MQMKVIHNKLQLRNADNSLEIKLYEYLTI